MTDAQTGRTDTSLGGLNTSTNGGTGQTESHSELFGLQGQKRASTTAGAGAGSGIIGTSGHIGSVGKRAGQDSGLPLQNAGISATSGPGGESFTPSQGTGDVRASGQAKGEKKLLDKLNPLK